MQQHAETPEFESGDAATMYNQAQFQQFMPGYEQQISSVDGSGRADGRFEVRHENGSGTMFYDTTQYAAPRGDYAGLYPGTISVGQDGVLRLEIGGSKSYVLTCMNSATKTPSPTQAPATTESQPEKQTEGSSAEESSATVAGIPVLHLCLFVGGMVLSVGGLITMYVVKRRREDEDGYEYEDDEDE